MRRVDKAIQGIMQIMRDVEEVPAQQALLDALLFETFGSCACKADENEPIFALRAQDATAPAVLAHWMTKVAGRSPNSPKLQIAAKDVERFEAWQAEHGCKVPD